jgi:hypothetical protein
MSDKPIPLPKVSAPPAVEVMVGKTNGSAVALGAPIAANSKGVGMIHKVFRII